MTKFSLAVSLAQAVGPIVKPLNQELQKQNAHAVTQAEFAFLDDVLHEEDTDRVSTERCPHCDGYLTTDAESEAYTCLNCARSTTPRRDVGQLVEELAELLLEHRNSD